MATRRVTRRDTPALCLLFGGISALGAVIFGLSWHLDIASRDELSKIEGRVERVEHTHLAKGGPKIHIYVTGQGKTHHITQDELRGVTTSINTLKSGDAVVALVKHDSLWRDLEWLWELRRDGQLLLSYEQTLAMHQRNGQRLRPVAYGSALISGLLFVLGLMLRNHFGAWQSAA